VQGFGCRSEARILLGRPRLKWEGKMDLREARRVRTDWTYLAQDRDRWRAFVNAVMNLRVP